MARKIITEDQLSEIMDFIYEEVGMQGQLRIGIWSDEKTPHTFYAVIYKGDNDLITGEASYGAASIQDALSELINDISDYKAYTAITASTKAT